MLTKQNVPINFSQGLDTKTDKYQVALGKFLRLQNSVFNKAGLLQKRNGYGSLPSLPDALSTFASTFNGNLTAVGNNFYALSAGAQTWVNKGAFAPLDLDTMPLIRSNTQQSYADSVTASNGLICTVYTDNIPDGAGATNPSYKYVIADSTTGQNIVAPTVITSTGTVTYAPKVFLLGSYFIIVFDSVISAVNHLQYVAINSVTPSVASAAADLSANYAPAASGTFDGVVANNRLYIGWNGNDGGGAMHLTYLNSGLTQGNTVNFATESGIVVSLAADTTQSTPVIWAMYYKTSGNTCRALAVNQDLVTLRAPTTYATGAVVTNITGVAQNSTLTVFNQLTNTYAYNSGTVRSDFIIKNTVTQSGTVGTATVVVRSVGLASKAFLISGVPYFLAVYQSPNQPSYFLLNSSGKVIAKLAYSNAGGYQTTGLPNVSISDSLVSIPYLFKDLVTSVNKSQGVSAPNGVYTQTGINRVTFNFSPSQISSCEIGANLHVTGGFLWAYDGFTPVEQGFNLYPDNIGTDISATGGNIGAGTYYYYAVYQWTDNQGNLHQSAPSIPKVVVNTGSTSTNTIYVPTLRLTYKTSNPVKIALFRWGSGQQTPYQVTSVTIPVYNDPTSDYVTITDTLADASIVGNSILYTNGGVIEDIGAPATNIVALWQTRLFLVDSEDRNLLWYSKQVIEATPVEMSDLLTIYVPPTTAAQGSTGPMTALFPLDDKLIIFKKNAIYYLTGQGPDNTGANNQYSDPVFVTATVGCSNPNSIAVIPQGIMFESDKGIWLLNRNMQTSYIGSDVEDFTQSATVQSAVNVPGTNQVRFTLSTGTTLMYDYYYGQWGTFVNVPAISSTIYGDLHTYIDAYGSVFQETPGVYLDGGKPVLLSFTTSWINLAGLQGYQRAYEFYMLGTFVSPHKLQMGIAYDYNSSPSQSDLITPDNYYGNYGYGNPSTNPGIYGGGYGEAGWGGDSIEWWRVFLETQKCTSFQIQLDEVFDASYGTSPGAGFTMSGIDLTVGVKKGRPTLPSSRSVG